MDDEIFDIKKINKKDIFIKNNYCFIILDTETCNGLSKVNNSIIQIAFTFLGTDYIFNSYCKPNESIPWKTDDEKFISKIKKEDLIFSPDLKKVLLSFKNIIHSINNTIPVLIAHNSYFDEKMINMCFKYYNIDIGKIEWCNTMNNTFFNIKDKNNKSIKSLENISKYLFKDIKINFHNAKNDVKALNDCLFKVHKNTENIASIVFEFINQKKYKNDIFMSEYKDILNNYEEFSINKLDDSKIIKIYKKILEKEKEIVKCKNDIKNKIIKTLIDNNNYLCIDNNEIYLNEYTMKQLDTSKIKNNYPEIYEESIKHVNYKKIIIKDKK